jgi:hypothetical protein
MPTNGLICAWDELLYTVQGSASGSHSGDGTGVYTWGGAGDTKYREPVFGTFVEGIEIAVGGNSGTGLWSVTYTGPGSPTGTTWTGSGWSSAVCIVKLTDVRIYDNADGTIRSQFNYEIFAGGVSRITGSYSDDSAAISPIDVPTIAVPIDLRASASGSTTGLPAYTASDVYSYSSQCAATVTGGWKYKEVGDASYRTCPVTLAPGSAPSVSGACENPEVSAVSAADTGSLSVTALGFNSVEKILHSSGTVTECCIVVICDGIEIQNECQVQPSPVAWAHYKTTSISKSYSGTVRAVADLPAAIKRFNTDFALLAYRSEMPQTQYTGSSSCDPNTGIPVTVSNVVEVHPHQAEILQVINYGAAAMEDTLGYHQYAPWSTIGLWEKTIDYTSTLGAVLCPSEEICGGIDPPTVTITYVGYTEPPDDEAYSSSRSYTFPSSVGLSADMAPYLGHASALARYFNSWCNPLWSFAVATDDWNVDAAPETWNDYWSKVGSQYLNNSVAAITTDTRNHLVSEPLEADGHASLLDSLIGGFRWLGIHRWQTKTISPKASFSYGEDQESLMTVDQGTVSATGTTITITPP